MANIALSQSSLAITGDTFRYFDSYDTPTFKTEALHLVSNEGQVKCLLLLYKWLTLVFFGYIW